MTVYDVIIVGAGPAGIFSALELSKNKNNLKILLVDKGNLVENRKKTEIMTGFGGAGTFSDGKLHFTPVLSHEKMFHLFSVQEYQVYLDYVESIFLNYGVKKEYYPKNLEQAKDLVENAERNNIKLFIRKTLHVGTDKLPEVIKRMQDDLKKRNIELLPNIEIEDILLKDNKIKGVKTKDNKEIFCNHLVLAPGRYNASWVEKITEKYNISKVHDKVEVGVRVEFPKSINNKHSELMYETIYSMYTPTYDDVVRTFCPCPKGFVAIEEYEDFVCVNGYSNSDNNGTNSNFALVVEVNLTKPLESTRKYAEFIARGVSLLGSGKPIIQRYKDLKLGIRSTENRLKRAYITPSLKTAVPGDIGMAMPYRITKDLIEGIEMLSKILPGLNGDSTFLYAPEVKFRSNKVETTKFLEVKNISNLYMAGDGAGVSGNIIGAAISGVVCAEGILERLET
ncbi:MAG: FAD-dependent oxidoreductase [Candidatus ainarchaeum sp.]|nr:FAD-dependent oxidoreductase [Candidatus ainarchaeum sp.]MDD4220803.1 FAD-dependent oxidoreductase [Candidatus ainarchaeum sp.]MDD4662302.1 FAD-dependent oxidoreductase [Candidatus ainarchaeum sp.]